MILEGFPAIVRRIAYGVQRARLYGYHPDKLYLTPRDREALRRAWLERTGFTEELPRVFGGMELRTTHNSRGQSKVYCRSGASVSLGRLPPAAPPVSPRTTTPVESHHV